MDTKQYQWTHNGTTYKGVKVGRRADGRWIMESPENTNVFYRSDDEIEEVFPTTIEVMFGTGGPSYSYLVDDDHPYRVGDFYVIPSAIAKTNTFVIVRVVSVNSRSPSATKRFEPILKLGNSLVGIPNPHVDTFTVYKGTNNYWRSV